MLKNLYVSIWLINDALGNPCSTLVEVNKLNKQLAPSITAKLSPSPILSRAMGVDLDQFTGIEKISFTIDFSIN